MNLAPAQLREILEKAQRAVEKLQGPTALICASPARCWIRQILESELPLLAVLSHAEVPPQVTVVSLGSVK